MGPPKGAAERHSPPYSDRQLPRKPREDCSRARSPHPPLVHRRRSPFLPDRHGLWGRKHERSGPGRLVPRGHSGERRPGRDHHPVVERLQRVVPHHRPRRGHGHRDQRRRDPGCDDHLHAHRHRPGGQRHPLHHGDGHRAAHRARGGLLGRPVRSDERFPVLRHRHRDLALPEHHRGAPDHRREHRRGLGRQAGRPGVLQWNRRRDDDPAIARDARVPAGDGAPRGGALRRRSCRPGPGSLAPGTRRGQPKAGNVAPGRRNDGERLGSRSRRRPGPGHAGRGRSPDLERAHRLADRLLRHDRTGGVRAARRPQRRALGRPELDHVRQPHRRGPRLLQDHLLRPAGRRGGWRLRPREDLAGRRLGSHRPLPGHGAHPGRPRAPGRERRVPGGAGCPLDEDLGRVLLGEEQLPQVLRSAVCRVERGARLLHRRDAGARLGHEPRLHRVGAPARADPHGELLPAERRPGDLSTTPGSRRPPPR